MKRLFIFILLLSVAAYAAVEYQDMIFKKTVTVNGSLTAVSTASVTGAITGKTSLILEEPGAGTNTLTLQSPTLAGNYVFTLPADDGTANQVLRTNGSGALSWVDQASGAVNLTPLVKTTNYTLSATDDLLLCDTSSNNITLTLPTAVGNDGKVFYIKKIASAYVCTLDANGSQTIDGELTQTLLTNYTAVTLVSDGANWLIL